jgi:hypothetical protein
VRYVDIWCACAAAAAICANKNKPQSIDSGRRLNVASIYITIKLLIWKIWLVIMYVFVISFRNLSKENHDKHPTPQTTATTKKE